MNFLDLQKDLNTLIWDTRTEWLPDEAWDNSKGSSLKKAVFYGIKETYDRLKENHLYQEQNYTEISLNVVKWEVTLPADYEITFEILNENKTELFNFIINKKQNKIIFDDELDQTITFKYLPKETVLNLITDEPNLEEHFRDSISYFATEKYHQAQFDWDNIAKSVAYAEEKLEDLISKYN